MKPLATLSLKHWSSAIIVVVLVVTLAALGNHFKSNAQRERPNQIAEQAHERLIEKKTNSAIPNEPVAIVLARIKKGVVEIGKTFEDGDNDWTKGFTLRAQNISPKTITYIDVVYIFERPKGEANTELPPLVDSLTFGSLNLNPNQLKLGPKESTDLALPDSTHDILKKALAQAGYPSSIKRIRFYLSQVVFEDETMWSLGYWYQRDRTNGGNWIRIPTLGMRVGSVGNGR